MTIDEQRTQTRLRTIARVQREIRRSRHIGRDMTEVEQHLDAAVDAAPAGRLVIAHQDASGEFVGVEITEVRI